MHNTHLQDWNDIRFVLAVAEAGTLSGAARALSVNHATVLRRVNAFEARVGVTLFDRHPRGLRVAPGRRAAIAAMRAMDEAAAGVGRALLAVRAPLAGVVRVTSTDTFCQAVLPAIAARLSEEIEGLGIELVAANRHVDLSRLDADIAVRLSSERPKGLDSEPAGELGFAVYTAPGARDRWLGLAGSLLRADPVAQWMASNVAPGLVTGRADSFLVLREMAARGQGRAILPCVLGEGDPRLVRLPGLVSGERTGIWVVSHPDMASVARIRTVRHLLVEALIREAPVLAG